MVKKEEQPIKTYEEYKRRLRKVKIIKFLMIVIPALVVTFLLSILFSNGKVLQIFGIKNFYAVINFFYVAFYVISAVVIVIIIIVAIQLLIKSISSYINDKKNDKTPKN